MLTFFEACVKYPDVSPFVILKIDIQRRGFIMSRQAMCQINCEKYQTKGQSILNVVQLGLGAIVGNLVGGKLIHILGYEKGYLLMAGIITLMTICALIVYFWKNREQRNGGDVCEI